MRKKILLLGLVVLGIVLCASLVSAYTPYNYAPHSYERPSCVNCGAMPYTPIMSTYRVRYQPEMPIRVGGFFGASSAYITGLRPGTYYNMPCVQRPGMFYQPCGAGTWFGPRIGGYFGYAGYYGLRPGMFTYGGYGARYSNINYMYHGPL